MTTNSSINVKPAFLYIIPFSRLKNYRTENPTSFPPTPLTAVKPDITGRNTLFATFITHLPIVFTLGLYPYKNKNCIGNCIKVNRLVNI